MTLILKRIDQVRVEYKRRKIPPLQFTVHKLKFYNSPASKKRIMIVGPVKLVLLREKASRLEFMRLHAQYFLAM